MFLPTYAFSIYLIGYQATDITKKENKLISSQSNMSNETVWFVLPTVDVVGHQAYLPTYLPTYGHIPMNLCIAASGNCQATTKGSTELFTSEDSVKLPNWPLIKQ